MLNVRSVQPSFLEISVLHGFHYLTRLIPNDLRPPLKNVRLLALNMVTHIPNMTSVEVSVLEIWCFQGIRRQNIHTYIRTTKVMISSKANMNETCTIHHFVFGSRNNNKILNAPLQILDMGSLLD